MRASCREKGCHSLSFLASQEALARATPQSPAADNELGDNQQVIVCFCGTSSRPPQIYRVIDNVVHPRRSGPCSSLWVYAPLFAGNGCGRSSGTGRAGWGGPSTRQRKSCCNWVVPQETKSMSATRSSR